MTQEALMAALAKMLEDIARMELIHQQIADELRSAREIIERAMQIHQQETTRKEKANG